MMCQLTCFYWCDKVQWHSQGFLGEPAGHWEDQNEEKITKQQENEEELRKYCYIAHLVRDWLPFQTVPTAHLPANLHARLFETIIY